MVARPDLWAAFIWPAYILTVGGLAAMLGWAFVSMRRAEKQAEELRRK
ncbi:heme exporter protein CcmD [Sandarakinorhabdus sp.]|nr:heme exporter protein CcmD [Sandarakinorhabdus sp.]